MDLAEVFGVHASTMRLVLILLVTFTALAGPKTPEELDALEEEVSLKISQDLRSGDPKRTKHALKLIQENPDPYRLSLLIEALWIRYIPTAYIDEAKRKRLLFDKDDILFRIQALEWLTSNVRTLDRGLLQSSISELLQRIIMREQNSALYVLAQRNASIYGSPKETAIAAILRLCGDNNHPFDVRSLDVEKN